MYLLKKALNNNVAHAVNENGIEFIVFGKGITLGKKTGAKLDDTLIYDFYFINNRDYTQFSTMIESISPEVIDVSEKIITEGKKVVDGEFNANLLLMIADHISFAIERNEKNMIVASPLQYEIKRLYHKEMTASKKALDIVEKELGVRLPKEEVAMVAMHFVNSQTNSKKMKDSILITQIINEIFNLINFHFQVILDETSNNASRFLVHLRYFVTKYIDDEAVDEDTEATLYDFLKGNHKNAYECAIKITKYLENQYGWTISINDRTYLILHINRLIGD